LLYPCIDVSISLLFERQTGDPIGGLTADQSVREGYKRQFKNKLAAVFGQFFQPQETGASQLVISNVTQMPTAVLSRPRKPE
jgi:hypothetical protein